MIFGGNLCTQLAFALVLGAALRAYGVSLPLADLVVINSLASLLGGVAPVPGGMGVTEAGLIAGMTAARRPATRRRGGDVHRPPVHHLPPAHLGLGRAAVAAPPRLRLTPLHSSESRVPVDACWAPAASCPPAAVAVEHGRRASVALDLVLAAGEVRGLLGGRDRARATGRARPAPRASASAA